MLSVLSVTPIEQPADSASHQSNRRLLGIRFETFQVESWQVKHSGLNFLEIRDVKPDAYEKQPEDNMVEHRNTADLLSTLSSRRR